MPVFNGINTDALEEFARRFLGIRQGGIMPSLSPEPSVSVNYPTMPDQLALASYMPFGAGGDVAAGGAGTFGAVVLINSTSSQLVTVIPSFTSSTTAQHAVMVAVPGNILGLGLIGPGLVAWMDTRRSPTSFPLGGNAIGIAQGTLATGSPAGYNRVAALVTTSNVMVTGAPIVLAPNTSLCIVAQTANLAFYWSFAGYLRDALPDELGSV